MDYWVIGKYWENITSEARDKNGILTPKHWERGYFTNKGLQRRSTAVWMLGILTRNWWSLQAGEPTERVTNKGYGAPPSTVVFKNMQKLAGWWFQPHILWTIKNVWNHQPARCPHHGTGYFENTLRLSVPRIKICGKSSCSHHIEAFQHCDESTQVGPSFPKRWTSTITNTSKNDIWLVVSTPLKNISQWEGLSHILWKIKAMFETTNQYIYIYSACSLLTWPLCHFWGNNSPFSMTNDWLNPIS
jgi:hypothetical protein